MGMKKRSTNLKNFHKGLQKIFNEVLKESGSEKDFLKKMYVKREELASILIKTISEAQRRGLVKYADVVKLLRIVSQTHPILASYLHDADVEAQRHAGNKDIFIVSNLLIRSRSKDAERIFDNWNKSRRK